MRIVRMLRILRERKKAERGKAIGVARADELEGASSYIGV
jgi:hypothetical protein